MRIFLTGQCTLHWGRMEFGNLGNYAIIEPLIRGIHEAFPDAEIRTTLQMSDDFCAREKVTVVPMESYYAWKFTDLPKSTYEVVASLAMYWMCLPVFKTRYMREVLGADLVIDFSGDIWGENASLVGRNRFFVGLAKDFVAQLLCARVAMIAGSPGPFGGRLSTKLAKFVYKRFGLVTNREPVSTRLLEAEGFLLENTATKACPAWLFDSPNEEEIQGILRYEGLLDGGRPLIGFVLCGWNMPVGPFSRWPRDHSEYEVFAEAIEYLVKDIGANVCLVSHNHAFTPPPNFELTPGRDSQLLQGLMEVLHARGIANNVSALKGLYECGTTKAIIRQFDMLVSGRIHAAVSGLSQCVPTVIIDYGHEPKAHKLHGFAEVAGVTEYIADPANGDQLRDTVRMCWKHRHEVRAHLEERIPEVQHLASENFTMLSELLCDK
jgi:colanic acid/amylovoran biosynthesis protein